MGLNSKQIISSVTIDGVEAHLVDGGIPEGYLKPSGEITITEQGSFDVKEYGKAIVTAPFDKKFAQLINGTLTEVTEEDLQGNTKVNDYAFYNQKNLSIIELPDNITSIGTSAFYGCEFARINSLKNITSIGDSAFVSFGTLANKEFDLFFQSGCTYGRLPLQYCGASKLKIFGYGKKELSAGEDNYLRGCTKLKELEFNEGAEIIGWQFCPSSSLIQKVILPTTILTIHEFGRQIPNLICKREEPPYLYSSTIINNTNIFISITSKDRYTSATNWSASSNYYPLVSTESDLASIDTTLYTKACVEGNDLGIEDDNNYAIYNYTDGNWVKES